MKEGQLRQTPGGFEPLGIQHEVAHRGGLADSVHQRPVGQGVREGPVQQTRPARGRKVFAIDPDQVGAAVAQTPRAPVGDQLVQQTGRVGGLDVHETDPVALRQPLRHPGEIGVDARVSAPGMPMHRLPARLTEDVRPVADGRRIAPHALPAACQGRCRQKKGGLTPCQSSHQRSCSLPAKHRPTRHRRSGDIPLPIGPAGRYSIWRDRCYSARARLGVGGAQFDRSARRSPCLMKPTDA